MALECTHFRDSMLPHAWAPSCLACKNITSALLIGTLRPSSPVTSSRDVAFGPEDNVVLPHIQHKMLSFISVSSMTKTRLPCRRGLSINDHDGMTSRFSGTASRDFEGPSFTYTTSFCARRPPSNLVVSTWVLGWGWG